jgi:hypothetical protein
MVTKELFVSMLQKEDERGCSCDWAACDEGGWQPYIVEDAKLRRKD